jgi:hypothetical protein
MRLICDDECENGGLMSWQLGDLSSSVMPEFAAVPATQVLLSTGRVMCAACGGKKVPPAAGSGTTAIWASGGIFFAAQPSAPGGLYVWGNDFLVSAWDPARLAKRAVSRVAAFNLELLVLFSSGGYIENWAQQASAACFE